MTQTPKGAQILRWLSLIPATMTAFIVSEWLVRLLIWFMLLPFSILGKLFGIGVGPLGMVMDRVSNAVFGIDSTQAVTLAAVSFAVGYSTLYVPVVLAPSPRRRTATVLAVALLLLMAGVIPYSLKLNGFVPEYFLGNCLNVVGIVSALLALRGEDELSHASFIERNARTIFLATTLFSGAVLFIALS